MRILQLCKKSPTPQRDGESVAIHQITKSFILKGDEVHVLSMLTSKHPNFDVSSELNGASYTYVKIPTEESIIAAFKSIFTQDPYIVERFYHNDFLLALIDKLNEQKYDVILCEGVFLGPYLDTIRKYSQAKVVLRAHNVEHVIWERLVPETKNWLKRVYLKRVMLPQFKHFEERFIKKVDAIVPISPIDEVYFSAFSKKPMLLIPAATDVFEVSVLPKVFSVGFIGGMDWQPNKEGVVWFLNEVWKPFVQDDKDVQLSIAGRNFPQEMLNWEYPKVSFMGEVPDAKVFVEQQSVIIAPIFSGSGMRVKIIEAMSLGKCVISSPVGAEGIQCENDKDILIAKEADQWIEALDQLWQSSDKLTRLGASANELAEREYSLSFYAEKLHVFLHNL
ncbi:MAG: glycosyltransferase involved in cell wall biosynthesis [Chitinophagales bacterium]